MAHELAAINPPEAERLLGLIEDPFQRSQVTPRLCYRMVKVDPDRARRLACSCADNLLEAHCFGVMAQALAETDKTTAAELLDEMYEMLDALTAKGQGSYTGLASAATVGAGFLPVSEQIDPYRVSEDFARVLMLRAPRKLDGYDHWMETFAQGENGLALLLARYDRQTARLILDRAHGSGVVSLSSGVDRAGMAAMALVDPEAAVARVEAMPTTNDTQRDQARDARFYTAATLARTPEDLAPSHLEVRPRASGGPTRKTDASFKTTSRMRRLTMLLLLLALCGPGFQPGESDAPAWQFVLPDPGALDEHPPLRIVPLSETPPEDVVEMVPYQGSHPRYGQIRYGSPGSVRVTVVLDVADNGQAALYVDSNRNRRIEPRDRVEGPVNDTWRVPLDVALVEGETTRLVPRAFVFRRGSSGRTLQAAAAGYLEGRLTLDGRAHAARRQDGDANGSLTDNQDRLQVDLNDDGRFDLFTEQWLFNPILTLAGQRYAVRSDELGHRLNLEPLVGTGSVRLAIARPETASQIVRLAATLYGREGSAISLTGQGGTAEVPVGEYRVGSLSLTCRDPGKGLDWTYVFSDSDPAGKPVWHRLEAGAELTIDPVGTLRFEARIDGDPEAVRSGDHITVSPRLHTAGDLLINTCYRGNPVTVTSDNGPGALLTLTSAGGTTVSSARSGFA